MYLPFVNVISVPPSSRSACRIQRHRMQSHKVQRMWSYGLSFLCVEGMPQVQAMIAPAVWWCGRLRMKFKWAACENFEDDRRCSGDNRTEAASIA